MPIPRIAELACDYYKINSSIIDHSLIYIYNIPKQETNMNENLRENLPVLAIITPCYNEEAIIQKSLGEFLNLLSDLINNGIVSDNSYISVVDDGSHDNSWKLLSEIAAEKKQIKLIKFPCNFGHQKAILCGIRQNKADIYLYMDFDLQDDISVIPDMIEKYKNNDVDIVFGVRKNRRSDTFLKKFLANSYYQISKILGVKGISNSADFNLISDNVANLLRNINEKKLYLRGLLHLYNFKYDTVYYTRKKRNGGIPKYSIYKSLLLALVGITSCSHKPLLIIFILAGICFLRCIIKFSDIYFVGGLILFALSIISLYLTKIGIESNNHPNYIIEKQVNYDKN